MNNQNKNISARIKIIVLFLGMCLPSSFYGQHSRAENVVGTTFKIQSKVLDETREIKISLPIDYDKTNKKYPVIYLLDGQRFFLYGASLQQSFSTFNLTPNFIVVGISNVQAKRMRTFSSGGTNFSEFIEKEVIPLIDANYRTSAKRLLFGWAYGGGFGLEVLMNKPTLFDGYILSSPYPVRRKMDNLKKHLNAYKGKERFLYFVSDKEEYGVKEGTETLHAYVGSQQTNLRWHFKELHGEEHRSTVYPALYHGIQAYFNNYKELNFYNLSEFKKAGGMDYVKNYYELRANMYGFANEMASFSKYSLLMLAIEANDFEQFQKFLGEFTLADLIPKLRASWATRIGAFYVKLQKYQEAIAVYQRIARKHPTSIRAQLGLGSAYIANGSKRKAKKAYKKVLSLDPDNTTAKNALEKL